MNSLCAVWGWVREGGAGEEGDSPPFFPSFLLRRSADGRRGIM